MPAGPRAGEELSVLRSGGVYAATVLFVLFNRLRGGVDASATASCVSFSVCFRAMHASPAYYDPLSKLDDAVSVRPVSTLPLSPVTYVSIISNYSIWLTSGV